MLATLRVRNVGAVDEVVLDLEDGLTVLTGETGAGKTLLVEALHLVLGGADRGLPVRDPSSPSSVEAVFVDPSGVEVVLCRERGAGGRLRATVDGQLASAQSLAERGATLCELHGQHEHQVLRAQGAARTLLDRAGGIDDGEVRRLRARRRELRDAQARLGGSEVERARRAELVAHERREIDLVAPSGAGELDDLVTEAAGLGAVLEAKDALVRAAAALDGDGDGPDAAGLVAGALGGVPKGVGAPRLALEDLLERIRAVARALRGEVEQVEADPERVEALHERVARLQALVRKHGSTLADVLARREALELEEAELAEDDRVAREADAELATLAVALAAAEDVVLAERTAAAATLEAAVGARLAPLAMPHARLAVEVAGPAGEDVRFLFAGSGSFDPAPLADAASGGELSRVMLALTLATHAGEACLVFDEVDAGVGGATALALAACLAELARDVQVLVVTHLATVAAAADHHVVVTRGAARGAPASVAPVTGRARVAEIARMLAGDASDPVALSHAEALLGGDPAVL